jgi:hypothetical protein
MLSKLSASCFIAAFFLGATAGAFGADSHDGTWKMNVEKSHYTSHPPPRSETVTISSDATTHHVEFLITMDDGATMKGGISFPRKGGPLEMHGFPPDPEIDHATAKIVSEDKYILSYFDKADKLTSTRVVMYHGNVAEAKSYVDGKLIDTEVVEKQ